MIALRYTKIIHRVSTLLDNLKDYMHNLAK